MLDRFGIIGSVVCAVHCSLPLILSFISSSAVFLFENEWIHFALLFILIPLALVSFLNTVKKTRQVTPLLMGTVGVFLLILAVTAGPKLQNTVPNFELLFTLLGSLVLIAAHFLSLNFVKKKHV